MTTIPATPTTPTTPPAPPAPTTLTMICPVYKEEEIIAAFYAELKRVLDGLAQRPAPAAVIASRILFVVDRSGDRTLEVLRGIAAADPAVQVLYMSSRFGHQMSLLAGIDHCDADIVGMMDSDLQHPPDLIPTLVETFERGHDIVFTIRQDSSDVSWIKQFTSRLFYRLVNKISQVPINESAADFRLISRRVADVFRTQIRERNQFMRGLMSWVGFNAVGVPFQVRARTMGRSHYTVGRLMRFAIEGTVSFSKAPLTAAVLVGFLFALFGFGLAIVTAVQYFLHYSLPSGWATLVILIAIFSGVQLIFLGIVGQYIGAVFDEVKARPHYIVDEKINV
jgi:polyisoprenyl-phosphate glycosyltransferase